jgi:hypothetical protein
MMRRRQQQPPRGTGQREAAAATATGKSELADPRKRPGDAAAADEEMARSSPREGEMGGAASTKKLVAELRMQLRGMGRREAVVDGSGIADGGRAPATCGATPTRKYDRSGKRMNTRTRKYDRSGKRMNTR